MKHKQTFAELIVCMLGLTAANFMLNKKNHEKEGEE